jgi:hypothetical protein
VVSLIGILIWYKRLPIVFKPLLPNHNEKNEESRKKIGRFTEHVLEAFKELFNRKHCGTLFKGLSENLEITPCGLTCGELACIKEQGCCSISGMVIETEYPMP